jgi:molybdate-binding protein/DNA-binding XRE family transcriptional regulator
VPVTTQLAQVRKSRAISAADLATRAGISRQTIYAIEAGTYVPNTEVTLRLARELEVPVEELFSLPEETAEPQSSSADVLSSTVAAKGQPVRLARVGNRRVGIPVSARPYFLPDADAVVTGRSSVRAFSPDDPSRKQLVLAGCDPATNLLARMVERAGVELIPAAASSKLALSWLQEGKVHMAGSHLQDPATGEFNLPYLKSEFPREEFAVVTFARWEEGLVVASGNPKGVRGIADLPRVTFINREQGSGSRALLDQLLKKARIPAKSVKGYARVAHGHLAAAYAVLSGEADCCLATRSAARTFDLDFIPLHSERYDLVMRKRTLELPAAQAFLDVLQRANLRRQLEVLAGYDTAQTGALLA